MNTRISTGTHAAVWIDHHHANVVHLGADAAQSTRLRAHVHPTAQHHSEVRSEHEFFAEVCGKLEGVDSLLVTGGRTALADFRHYAEKHRPQIASRIGEYQVVDHPTENQLVAIARRYFEL